MPKTRKDARSGCRAEKPIRDISQPGKTPRLGISGGIRGILDRDRPAISGSEFPNLLQLAMDMEYWGTYD